MEEMRIWAVSQGDFECAGWILVSPFPTVEAACAVKDKFASQYPDCEFTVGSHEIERETAEKILAEGPKRSSEVVRAYLTREWVHANWGR